MFYGRAVRHCLLKIPLPRLPLLNERDDWAVRIWIFERLNACVDIRLGTGHILTEHDRECCILNDILSVFVFKIR
jgi:hypothetical protein